MIQFFRYKTLALPLEAVALSPIVSQMRQRFGIDCGRTADWITRFSAEKEVYAAIREAWRETHLPLRLWSERISDICAYHDGEAGLFGILVSLADMQPQVVLQQAPLDRQHCASELSRLYGTAPDVLVDLWSAVPGLTLEPDVVAALPEFVQRPMERLAKANYGPESTVDDCVRADVALPDGERAACELVWFRQGLQCQFVVLDKSLYPYTNLGDEDGCFRPLGLSVDEVVDLLLRSPAKFQTAVSRAVDPHAAPIEWRRPGDAVRERFGRLDVLDRAAVTLRAAERACEGADDSPVWDDVHQVIDACRDAIILGTNVDAEAAQLADDIGGKWLECSNRYVQTTLLGHFDDIVQAINGQNDALYYPLYRLQPGAACPPVYETIAEDIDLLERYRAESGDPSGQRARAKLLNDPL